MDTLSIACVFALLSAHIPHHTDRRNSYHVMPIRATTRKTGSTYRTPTVTTSRHHTLACSLPSPSYIRSPSLVFGAHSQHQFGTHLCPPDDATALYCAVVAMECCSWNVLTCVGFS